MAMYSARTREHVCEGLGGGGYGEPRGPPKAGR